MIEYNGLMALAQIRPVYTTQHVRELFFAALAMDVRTAFASMARVLILACDFDHAELALVLNTASLSGLRNRRKSHQNHCEASISHHWSLLKRKFENFRLQTDTSVVF